MYYLQKSKQQNPNLQRGDEADEDKISWDSDGKVAVVSIYSRTFTLSPLA